MTFTNKSEALDLQDFQHEQYKYIKKIIKDGENDTLRNLLGESLVNIRKNQNTPLHRAIAHQNIVAIKILLQNKLDINTQNTKGDTPLHIAILTNRSDIVEMLLENNTNPNIRNKKGNTALHLSIKEGNRDLSFLLLNYNADFSIKNNKGESCFMLAQRMQNPDIFNNMIHPAHRSKERKPEHPELIPIKEDIDKIKNSFSINQKQKPDISPAKDQPNLFTTQTRLSQELSSPLSSQELLLTEERVSKKSLQESEAVSTKDDGFIRSLRYSRHSQGTLRHQVSQQNMHCR